MVDGQHRGGDEPRSAKQRTDGDLYGDHQQVQVVSSTFLSQQLAQYNWRIFGFHKWKELGTETDDIEKNEKSYHYSTFP